MGIAVALLASACAPAIAPGPRALPAARAEDPGRVGRIWIPTSREMSVVRTVGETTLVLAGPWRAAIDGDRISVSEQRIEGRLERAVECASGAWVFHADDGLVASRASFLGPLRSIGDVPPEAEVQDAGAHLLVFAHEEELHIADCEGVRRVAPGLGRILRAAFATPSFGAVVVNGGRVAITSDGGASFRFHPMAEHAAAWVAVTDDTSIEVRGSNGLSLLHADGRSEAPAPRASVEEDRARLDDEAVEALSRAILAHDPLTRDAMPLVPQEPCEGAWGSWAVRSGGAIVTRIGDTLTRFDAAGGYELIPLPSLECPVLHAIDGRVVVREGQPHSAVSFFALTDTRWEESPIDTLERPCDLVVSDDHTHLAYRASCSSHSSECCVIEARDGGADCVPDDAGGRIVGARQGVPLIHSEDFGGFLRLHVQEEGSYEAIGCEDGEVECEGPPYRAVDAVGWDPGGDLIVRTRSEIQDDGTRSSPQFFRGPTGDELRPFTVPDHATEVAIGPRGGVAASWDRLWLTDDGGERWRGVETDLRELSQPAEHAFGARCDRSGCYLNGGVWISGFATPRADALLHAPRVEHVAEREGGPRLELDCVDVGPSVPARDEVTGDRGTIERAGIRVQWTSSGTGDSRVERLRWSADDGVVEGSGGLIGAGSERAWFEPVAAVREGILVRRCNDGGCALVHVPRGRPIEAPAPSAPERQIVWSDGVSIFVYASEPFLPDQVTRYFVAPIVIRHFTFRGTDVTFARIGGEARLVAREGARVRLYDLEPPIEEAPTVMELPFDETSLTVCPDHPGAPSEVWQWQLGDDLAEVERHGERYCVSSTTDGSTRLAAHDGALEGWVQREGDRARLRCSLVRRD